MTDRPIIFSTPMVLALLAGRKSQTRRILKNQDLWTQSEEIVKHFPRQQSGVPYSAGDRLWCRELWRTESRAYDDLPPSDMDADYPIVYEADADWSSNKTVGRKRQAMHMPRWASRLTLIVSDVRVQRLQDISAEDAIAEGLEQHGRFYGYPDADWDDGATDAREAYAALWAKIHGPASWVSNPWVCAISFRCIQGNIDHIPSEVAA